MAKGKGKGEPAKDLATRNFQAGCKIVASHPMLRGLYYDCYIIRDANESFPDDGWATVDEGGCIRVHPKRRGEPEVWAYVIAHCLLHLAFGHFGRAFGPPREWNTACDVYIAKFLSEVKIGQAPGEIHRAPPIVGQSEERLCQDFLDHGIPSHMQGCGTAGDSHPDMVESGAYPSSRDWQETFARGLVTAVTEAVEVAAGVLPHLGATRPLSTVAQRAREWLINSYPLLGGLAATFTIIEDPLLCQQMAISVAAVDPERREIYLNPAAGLKEEETRFVIAHELLHAGLRHDTRRQGRDPYLWNVACDYVINGWLVEMHVGAMPAVGALHDPSLVGESAESIYDRIVNDQRFFRKLGTFRGKGLGDMLEPHAAWWAQGEGVTLDEFYRRALAQGLSYHQGEGRGFLPAGLVEEIRALDMRPIPWDVALARWFDHCFPLLEKRRSYSRPSRRQSVNPEIPLPRYVPPPDELMARTFGVVLDTSGSMDRNLLGRALGAIASYCLARDVPAARVVFCDAAPYDQGYMPPEAILDRVQVRGRGGTVLQPGIDLLDHAKDFPKDGPLLIITDGRCDRLTVKREHAFLMPAAAGLPFAPRGPVFRIEKY